MSAFTDVVHRVATLGEHVIEHVDGHHHITLNGALVAAEDVVKIVHALQEIAPLLGVTAAELAAA